MHHRPDPVHRDLPSVLQGEDDGARQAGHRRPVRTEVDGGAGVVGPAQIVAEVDDGHRGPPSAGAQQPSVKIRAPLASSQCQTPSIPSGSWTANHVQHGIRPWSRTPQEWSRCPATLLTDPRLRPA